jgi:DNA endonuclease activator SAE2/CtIP C-terminus
MAGASPCNNIQQVSRHRHQWEPEPKPPGFWMSGFPTDEELERNRAESARLEGERVKKIAEEAARGDGRWKERNK